MWLCQGGGGYVTVHMWRSENSLCELTLSFYHVGPGDQTHVIRLSGSYLLSWSVPFFPAFDTMQLQILDWHQTVGNLPALNSKSVGVTAFL